MNVYVIRMRDKDGFIKFAYIHSNHLRGAIRRAYQENPGYEVIRVDEY